MSDPAAPQYYRGRYPGGMRTRTVKTYTDERSCPECGLALSRYNAGPYCGAHARYNPLRFPRLRGRTTEDG